MLRGGAYFTGVELKRRKLCSRVRLSAAFPHSPARQLEVVHLQEFAQTSIRALIQSHRQLKQHQPYPPYNKMSIERREFNKQCVDFVTKCRNLGDPWLLFSGECGRMRVVEMESSSEDELIDSTLMLSKCQTVASSSPEDVQVHEYSVVYSESYAVPVMYFCVSNQGKLHTLDWLLLRHTARS